MQMHPLRKTNICFSLKHTRTPKKYYVITFLVLPSAGDDDGISRLARGKKTGSNLREEKWNEERKGSTEEDGEREMELLGGFHRVRMRRGASAKVCLSQRGAGDDSHPSTHDERRGSVFLPRPSPTHGRYHTDVLMRLRSTGCHTCIHCMLIM